MSRSREELRKTYLVKRQEEIAREISSINQILVDKKDSDKELELETLIREHENNELILKRLENPSVELCHRCGDEIPEKRLKALETNLCVHCANEDEELQRKFGHMPTHSGYGCESRI